MRQIPQGFPYLSLLERLLSSLDRADRLEPTREGGLRIECRQQCVQPETMREASHGTTPDIRQRRWVSVNFWMQIGRLAYSQLSRQGLPCTCDPGCNTPGGFGCACRKVCVSRQGKAYRVFDRLKSFSEARGNERSAPNLPLRPEPAIAVKVSGQALGLIESVSLTNLNPCDNRTGFLKPGKWNPATIY